MFTKAIVRKPGKNFADGITTAGLGKPDYKKALQQHEAYCDALRKTGLDVSILEADEKELMTVTKGRENLPPEAEIYRSITCERCGEKAAEPKVRIKDGKIVCIPCYDSTSRRR